MRLPICNSDQSWCCHKVVPPLDLPYIVCLQVTGLEYADGKAYTDCIHCNGTKNCDLTLSTCDDKMMSQAFFIKIYRKQVHLDTKQIYFSIFSRIYPQQCAGKLGVTENSSALCHFARRQVWPFLARGL